MLIDVTVRHKQTYDFSSTVLDLGYSHHLAQILNITVNRPRRGPAKIWKRQFTKEGNGEFNYS
jgi:hypothetical protein